MLFWLRWSQRKNEAKTFYFSRSVEDSWWMVFLTVWFCCLFSFPWLLLLFVPSIQKRCWCQVLHLRSPGTVVGGSRRSHGAAAIFRVSLVSQLWVKTDFIEHAICPLVVPRHSTPLKNSWMALSGIEWHGSISAPIACRLKHRLQHLKFILNYSIVNEWRCCHKKMFFENIYLFVLTMISLWFGSVFWIYSLMKKQFENTWKHDQIHENHVSFSFF